MSRSEEFQSRINSLCHERDRRIESDRATRRQRGYAPDSDAEATIRAEYDKQISPLTTARDAFIKGLPKVKLRAVHAVLLGSQPVNAGDEFKTDSDTAESLLSSGAAVRVDGPAPPEFTAGPNILTRFVRLNARVFVAGLFGECELAAPRIVCCDQKTAADSVTSGLATYIDGSDAVEADLWAYADYRRELVALWRTWHGLPFSTPNDKPVITGIRRINPPNSARREKSLVNTNLSAFHSPRIEL